MAEAEKRAVSSDSKTSSGSSGGRLTHRRLSSNAMRIFTEMREKGQLCDVWIEVQNGEKFQAHKAILSGSSYYFRCIFTSGFRESGNNSGSHYLKLGTIPAPVMIQIINYAYTRQVELTPDNFQDVTVFADQLLIDGLLKLCQDFIIDNLDVYNCLMVHQFAKFYSFKQVRMKVWKFILMKFEDVVSKRVQEFLDLTPENLMSILSDDYLNVENEHAVWKALKLWLQHDSTRRKCFFPAAVRTVRLPLMQRKLFLAEVLNDECIKADACSRQLSLEVFKVLHGIGMDKFPDQFPQLRDSSMLIPRVPSCVLLVIGGWSVGSPTGVIETYDYKAEKWIQHPQLEDPKGARAYHGCAVVNNEIFMVGGFDGIEYFNSVRHFNIVSKAWTERAPMNSPRCYVSVAVVGGHVYAMGGYNGSVRLNTTERYTPKTNQWTHVAPMQAQRSDSHAAVLEGKIYICGGFNGSQCMNTAEVYDPKKDQWSLIPEMQSRRSGVGVVALRGCIYAIGGFNGTERLKSAERFDPVKNRWTTLPDMNSPRSNFALEVLQDTIFVIGGFNGSQTIPSAEYFDEENQRWVCLPEMAINRSALYACVLSQIPNIEDYIFRNRKDIWNNAFEDHVRTVHDREALLTLTPPEWPGIPLRAVESQHHLDYRL